MDYTQIELKAKRGMIRDILDEVSKNGLTDNSHYLITFQTNRDDVIIPDFVRAKYPEQISIIIQHQFFDLKAEDSSFSVSLAFGGVHSTITVPYIAIIQFADPSCGFGFILEPEDSQPTNVSSSISSTVIDLSRFRKK